MVEAPSVCQFSRFKPEFGTGGGQDAGTDTLALTRDCPKPTILIRIMPFISPPPALSPSPFPGLPRSFPPFSHLCHRAPSSRLLLSRWRLIPTWQPFSPTETGAIVAPFHLWPQSAVNDHPEPILESLFLSSALLFMFFIIYLLPR